MKSGKICCAVVLFLLAAALVFAAGGKESAAEKKVETVVIEHWTHWVSNNAFYEPYWETAAKKFTASRKDVNFSIKVVSIPYEGYEAKYASGFQAKMGPGMFNDMTHVPAGQLGVCDPMPKDIADKLDKILLNATKPFGMFNGVRYGLPVEGGNFMMMFVNTDLFKEAGLDPDKPPKTFQEMLDYAKKLTKYDANGKIARAGYGIRYKGHPFGIADKVAPFFHAWGATWMNWDQKKASGYINSPESIAALAFYGDLVNKYKVATLELDNPDALFGQGLAAIHLRESWYAAWLQANAPTIKFKVFPLPKEKMDPGVSNNFPWAINVNKDLREPDRKWLWEFFRWYVNSPEIRLEHFLGSKMLPAYNDIDDPFFKSRPEYEAWKTMSAGRMAPTYYVPPAQQILTTVGDATLAVLYNKQDSKAALDAAAVKIDQIMAKYK